MSEEIASPSDLAPEPEFVHWELTIKVAGPYYTDTIVLTDVDRQGLDPRNKQAHDGTWFEEYEGESKQEYIAVRADWIATKTLVAVCERPESPVQPAQVTPGIDDVPIYDPDRVSSRGSETSGV